jgi:hypothetical protein
MCVLLLRLLAVKSLVRFACHAASRLHCLLDGVASVIALSILTCVCEYVTRSYPRHSFCLLRLSVSHIHSSGSLFRVAN